MINEKLIKSFIVIQDFDNFKKDEVLTMKRRQATIPLMNELIMFENQSSRENITLQRLLQNNYVKVKPLEFFQDNIEKFEHIS